MACALSRLGDEGGEPRRALHDPKMEQRRRERAVRGRESVARSRETGAEEPFEMAKAFAESRDLFRLERVVSTED